MEVLASIDHDETTQRHLNFAMQDKHIREVIEAMEVRKGGPTLSGLEREGTSTVFTVEELSPESPEGESPIIPQQNWHPNYIAKYLYGRNARFVQVFDVILEDGPDRIALKCHPFADIRIRPPMPLSAARYLALAKITEIDHKTSSWVFPPWDTTVARPWVWDGVYYGEKGKVIHLSSTRSLWTPEQGLVTHEMFQNLHQVPPEVPDEKSPLRGVRYGFQFKVSPK